MRNSAKRALLVAATAVVGGLSAYASVETGSYNSGSGGNPNNPSGNSKNTSGQDHNAQGTCTTDLEGTYPYSYQHQAWMDATSFPLAGGAGIAKCSFGPTKYEATGVTNKQVKIKTVERKQVLVAEGYPNAVPPIPPTYQYVTGEGSTTGAVFDANCHEPKKAAAPTQVPQGGQKETGNTGKTNQEPGVKVDPDLPDFVFRTWICGTGAGHIFHYQVTNNYCVPVAFSWPAVRTPDHPDGWSATVEPNSTLEYACEQPGEALLVYGSPGVVTVTTTEDATLVVGRHVTDAWCPASSVDVPTEVSGLSAVSGPATVALSWINAQAYDSIQVFRYINGQEPHVWDVAGTETTFVDEDPPLGVVRYEVIGVNDGVGAETVPTVTVIRN